MQFDFAMRFRRLPACAQKRTRGKRALSACQNSLAEFAARRRQIKSNHFPRGVYLAENTAQAASVRLVRLRRTRRARSRLQSFCPKSP